RFEADRLNRHAALSWINKGWLEGLVLPSELAVFGPESQPETSTLQEAIERELTKDDTVKTIAVYMPVHSDDWDLAVARRLRRQLMNWENSRHQVQLHLLEDTFEVLPGDQKDWLARLAFSGIGIHLNKTMPDHGVLR